MSGYKFGHTGDHATPEWRKSIGEDNPTAAVLTLGAVQKLSSALAGTLARYEEMNSVLSDQMTKLAGLEADLDAMKKQRESNEASAERIALWKASQ
jgi:hypothetical protein